METKSVAFALRELNNTVRRAMESAVAGEGIPHVQAWIVGYLDEHKAEDVFLRDLEREFNLRRPTLCCILQRMEKAGLIERQSVEGDGRLKKLVLTPRSSAFATRMQSEFRRFEACLERGIGEEERAVFAAVLEKVRNNALLYGQKE